MYENFTQFQRNGLEAMFEENRDTSNLQKRHSADRLAMLREARLAHELAEALKISLPIRRRKSGLRDDRR